MFACRQQHDRDSLSYAVCFSLLSCSCGPENSEGVQGAERALLVPHTERCDQDHGYAVPGVDGVSGRRNVCDAYGKPRRRLWCYNKNNVRTPTPTAIGSLATRIQRTSKGDC